MFGEMSLKMAQRLPRQAKQMLQAKSKGIPWAMFWGMARGMVGKLLEIVRKYLSEFLRENFGKRGMSLGHSYLGFKSSYLDLLRKC